jgi:hypothetical protein
MSSIKLESNASGTGIFTIASPNSNTNRTLTLPDSSGTLALAGSSLTGVTDSASPFETALGTGAGGSNTGVNNTFIGYNAGTASTTGANNTAVGYGALDANQTGVDNTAVGYNALGANTTNYNNAFGYETMFSTTTGTRNNAMGRQALYTNTTGNDNVALGHAAMRQNTTGSSNTAVGYEALYDNTTGADNTAVGYGALDACTTGIDNVALGSGALGASTTASYNVAIGKNALNSLTTSTANVVIGNTAGTNVTGAGNVIIGEGAVSASAADAYSIVIGRVNGSNITGKGGGTGFINPNNGGVYQGNNSSSWSTTSDQRLKKNIVDNTEGLDKVSAIRVRNFEYRTEEEVTDLPTHAVINKAGVQLGVIAQELQQVCPDCVKEETTGVLSVDSDNIFWHMVNAIKDLKAINDAQATRIEALETKVAALEAK